MLAPLVLGGAVYLLLRPDGLVMFDVAALLGAEPALTRLRDEAAGLHRILPGWAVFSIPAALYAFSLTAFLQLLWGDGRGTRAATCAVCAALAAASELLQHVGAVVGTFDSVDLGLALVAVAAATLATSLPDLQPQGSDDASYP